MRTRSCDRRSVALLANDALEPRLVPQVRAHLATCGECRRYLEELNALGNALGNAAQSLPPRVLPGRVYARVADRIAVSPEPGRILGGLVAWPRWGWLAGVAVGCAVVLFFALGQERFSKDSKATRSSARARPAPVPMAVPRTEPSSQYFVYRRALNRSDSDLERLLAGESGGLGGGSRTTYRVGRTWLESEL